MKSGDDGRWGYETSEGNFVELVTRQEKNPLTFRTSLKVLEEILEGAPNLKADAENGLISFTVSGGKLHFTTPRLGTKPKRTSDKIWET